jgi:hypothetical protein
MPKLDITVRARNGGKAAFLDKGDEVIDYRIAASL